jgi:hypothetical protein
VPPLLQSWPGIVHGGGLIGLFDTAATALGRAPESRNIEGRVTSPVPTGKPLALEAHVDGDTTRFTIVDDAHTLGSGTVSAIEAGEEAAARWAGGDDGWPLPLSENCLACGALNPLGLQTGLRFDQDGVWTRMVPRSPWRTASGGLHPALASVLLDEIAWWLGALIMKEGGLTNRIRVRLRQPDTRADGPLVAAGRFDAVTPVDRKRSFWRSETALLGAGGTVIASASIVFRGGADYSAPQMEYFRSRTPHEIFRRMFPNYAG